MIKCTKSLVEILTELYEKSSDPHCKKLAHEALNIIAVCILGRRECPDKVSPLR